MEKVNFDYDTEKLEKTIEKAVDVLKEHEVETKELQMTFVYEFYEHLGKEYWSNYLAAHKGVSVVFIDNKGVFLKLLPDGSLMSKAF